MQSQKDRSVRCDGFILDGPVRNAVKLDVAASVNIARGDLLYQSSGYMTNASLTELTEKVKFFVAIEPCDNSAGAAGALSVLCVQCDAGDSFWAPNESSTVAAQADIGTYIDIESEDGVDVTDTADNGLGFLVDAIDTSAAAVAVKTGGYVRGRFVVIGQSA
jgi:hypothetical protein